LGSGLAWAAIPILIEGVSFAGNPTRLNNFVQFMGQQLPFIFGHSPQDDAIFLWKVIAGDILIGQGLHIVVPPVFRGIRRFGGRNPSP